MSLVIAFLYFALILVALLLILLVLIQLPKKEAGVGAAFGADATMAVLGAGSGTALTRITRWSATGFLLLCLLISVLSAQQVRSRKAGVRDLVEKTPVTQPVAPAAAAVPALTVSNAAAPATPAALPAPTTKAPAPTPAPTPATPAGGK